MMAKWDNDKIRIAVTGVAGGCGQAIMHALAKSKLPVEVYPVDVTPLSAGLHTGIGGTVLPYPERDLDAWRKWCINWRIDAIIPGSDHDLAPLAAVRDEWLNKWQIRLLVNPLFACEVSNDKMLTARYLRECGLDVPISVADEPDASVPYYLKRVGKWVIKPRFGMASRDVHITDNEAEAVWYWNRVDNPVIQEYINGDEFTCALFFDQQSCLRACFVMRRWLKNGDTHIAEAGEFPDVVQFCHEFAEKTRARFRWQGAVNIQLKRHPERGCVVFEINARCSGSTAMRAGFGYNEPAMLIRQFVMHEPVEQPETGRGVAMRQPDYVFLDEITHEELTDRTRGMKGRKL